MKSHAVSAEVSGTVWKILVGVGDAVGAEQEVVILESMKMEIPTAAPRCGVVRQILVEQGEAVGEGQALLIIEAR
jgi:acetyl-CoA carboxylase biotin carboxyl carrier protein